MEMNDQIFNELSKSPHFKKAEKKQRNELNTSVVSNSSNKTQTLSQGLKRKPTFRGNQQIKSLKLDPKQKPLEKKVVPQPSAFEIKPQITTEDEDENAENLVEDFSPEIDNKEVDGFQAKIGIELRQTELKPIDEQHEEASPVKRGRVQNLNRFTELMKPEGEGTFGAFSPITKANNIGSPEIAIKRDSVDAATVEDYLKSELKTISELPSQSHTSQQASIPTARFNKDGSNKMLRPQKMGSTSSLKEIPEK